MAYQAVQKWVDARSELLSTSVKSRTPQPTTEESRRAEVRNPAEIRRNQALLDQAQKFLVVGGKVDWKTIDGFIDQLKGLSEIPSSEKGSRITTGAIKNLRGELQAEIQKKRKKGEPAELLLNDSKLGLLVQAAQVIFQISQAPVQQGEEKIPAGDPLLREEYLKVAEEIIKDGENNVLSATFAMGFHSYLELPGLRDVFLEMMNTRPEIEPDIREIQTIIAGISSNSIFLAARKIPPFIRVAKAIAPILTRKVTEDLEQQGAEEPVAGEESIFNDREIQRLREIASKKSGFTFGDLRFILSIFFKGRDNEQKIKRLKDFGFDQAQLSLAVKAVKHQREREPLPGKYIYDIRQLAIRFLNREGIEVSVSPETPAPVLASPKILHEPTEEKLQKPPLEKAEPTTALEAAPGPPIEPVAPIQKEGPAAPALATEPAQTPTAQVAAREEDEGEEPEVVEGDLAGKLTREARAFAKWILDFTDSPSRKNSEQLIQLAVAIPEIVILRKIFERPEAVQDWEEKFSKRLIPAAIAVLGQGQKLEKWQEKLISSFQGRTLFEKARAVGQLKEYGDCESSEELDEIYQFVIQDKSGVKDEFAQAVIKAKQEKDKHRSEVRGGQSQSQSSEAELRLGQSQLPSDKEKSKLELAPPRFLAKARAGVPVPFDVGRSELRGQAGENDSSSPKQGLMKLVSSKSIGGKMFHLLLLVPIVGTLFLILSEAAGIHGGLKNVPRHEMIYAMVFGVLFPVYTFFLCRALDKQDLKRKKAEEKLQKSLVFFNTVFNSVSDPILILDPSNFRIIKANKSFLDTFKVKEESVIGKTCYAVTHHRATPCTAPHDICPLAETLRTGTHARAVHVHFDKDGGAIDVEVITSPIKNEKGETTQIIHAVRNITERKLAEIKTARLAAIVEGSGDVACAKDMEGRVVAANTEFLKMAGVTTLDEVLGKTDAEIFGKHTPGDIFTAWMADEAQARQGKVIIQEEPAFYPDGTKKTVLVHKFPVRDEQGGIIGTANISRDITERKKAEEALRSSEERLQKAQRMAHIGNWDWNIQTGKLHWEEENYRIFGLPNETIPSVETFLGTIHPDDLEFVKQSIQDALDGKKPYDLDMRIRRSDGTERVVHAHGEVDRDAGGKPIRLFGTVQDVTEHKRMEKELKRHLEELQQAQTFIQRVLDAIPLSVFIKDASGRLVYVNEKAARELYDRPKIGVFGKTDHQLYPGNPVQAESFRVADLEVFQKATIVETEETNQLAGKERVMHVRKIPIFTAEGKPQFIVGIAEDVTKKREIDRRLRNSEAWEIATTVVGPIAHDFNNLLTLPVGYADMIELKLKAGEDVTVELREIHRAIDKMAALSTNLRILSTAGTKEFEVFDLNEIVKSTAVIPQAQSNTVTLTVEGLQTPNFIKGDKGQMTQIVSNLVINATEAIPDRGEVTVSVSSIRMDHLVGVYGDPDRFKPGEYIRVAVKDTGTGIPPEVMKKLFRPFNTTKTTQKKRGTGLGLPSVKALVQSHGGFVDVVTRTQRDLAQEQGTTFFIYIPATQERPTVKEASTMELRGGTENIWVIDDEEQVRVVAAGILKKFGYTVTIFESGQEAEKFARNLEGPKPDLIISDMKMGGDVGAGIQSFKKLKKILNNSDLKGIAMSGYHGTEMTTEDVFQAGFGRFLAKPLELVVSSLIPRVRNELDKDKSSGDKARSEATPAAPVAAAPVVVTAVPAPKPAPEKTGVHLRVLIVDDDPGVSKALFDMIRNSQKNVPGSVASNLQEAITQLQKPDNFDLVLLDQHLPDTASAIELAKKIREIDNKRGRKTWIALCSGAETLDEFKPLIDIQARKPIGLDGIKTLLADVQRSIEVQSPGQPVSRSELREQTTGTRTSGLVPHGNQNESRIPSLESRGEAARDDGGKQETKGLSPSAIRHPTDLPRSGVGRSELRSPTLRVEGPGGAALPDILQAAKEELEASETKIRAQFLRLSNIPFLNSSYENIQSAIAGLDQAIRDGTDDAVHQAQWDVEEAVDDLEKVPSRIFKTNSASFEELSRRVSVVADILQSLKYEPEGLREAFQTVEVDLGKTLELLDTELLPSYSEIPMLVESREILEVARKDIQQVIREGWEESVEDIRQEINDAGTLLEKVSDNVFRPADKREKFQALKKTVSGIVAALDNLKYRSEQPDALLNDLTALRSEIRDTLGNRVERIGDRKELNPIPYSEAALGEGELSARKGRSELRAARNDKVEPELSAEEKWRILRKIAASDFNRRRLSWNGLTDKAEEDRSYAMAFLLLQHPFMNGEEKGIDEEIDAALAHFGISKTPFSQRDEFIKILNRALVEASQYGVDLRKRYERIAQHLGETLQSDQVKTCQQNLQAKSRKDVLEQRPLFVEWLSAFADPNGAQRKTLQDIYSRFLLLPHAVSKGSEYYVFLLPQLPLLPDTEPERWFHLAGGQKALRQIQQAGLDPQIEALIQKVAPHLQRSETRAGSDQEEAGSEQPILVSDLFKWYLKGTTDMSVIFSMHEFLEQHTGFKENDSVEQTVAGLISIVISEGRSDKSKRDKHTASRFIGCLGTQAVETAQEALLTRAPNLPDAEKERILEDMNETYKEVLPEYERFLGKRASGQIWQETVGEAKVKSDVISINLNQEMEARISGLKNKAEQEAVKSAWDGFVAEHGEVYNFEKITFPSLVTLGSIFEKTRLFEAEKQVRDSFYTIHVWAGGFLFGAMLVVAGYYGIQDLSLQFLAYGLAFGGFATATFNFGKYLGRVMEARRQARAANEMMSLLNQIRNQYQPQQEELEKSSRPEEESRIRTEIAEKVAQDLSSRSEARTASPLSTPGVDRGHPGTHPVWTEGGNPARSVPLSRAELRLRPQEDNEKANLHPPLGEAQGEGKLTEPQTWTKVERLIPVVEIHPAVEMIAKTLQRIIRGKLKKHETVFVDFYGKFAPSGDWMGGVLVGFTAAGVAFLSVSSIKALLSLEEGDEVLISSQRGAPAIAVTRIPKPQGETERSELRDEIRSVGGVSLRGVGPRGQRSLHQLRLRIGQQIFQSSFSSVATLTVAGYTKMLEIASKTMNTAMASFSQKLTAAKKLLANPPPTARYNRLAKIPAMNFLRALVKNAGFGFAIAPVISFWESTKTLPTSQQNIALSPISNIQPLRSELRKVPVLLGEVRADKSPTWPAHDPVKIAVIGTGFVGATKSILLVTDWGHDVIGVDVKPEIVEKLSQGKLTFHTESLQELLGEGLASGRLSFTTDYVKALEGREIIFLAVPTPQDETGHANISALENSVRRIAQLVKPGEPKIIVGKSTAPPRDTVVALKQVVQEEFQKRQSAGEDLRGATIHFAWEPEFLREGKEVEDDRGVAGRIVIGAEEPVIAERVKALYAHANPDPGHARKQVPIVIMNLTSAQLVKYTANGWRSIKISFANFVSLLTEALGLSIDDVMDTIGADPRIRRSFLSAGLGFGGSCFPKDLAAFVQIARKNGVLPGLVLDALAVNELQWQRFLEKVIIPELQNVQGKTIAVLGASFKPGTDDIRESRSVKIIEKLLSRGARIRVYDPVAVPRLKDPQGGPLKDDTAVEYYSDPSQMNAMLEGADAMILATEWPEFAKIDFEGLKQWFTDHQKPLPPIFDGRNFFGKARFEGLPYPYFNIGHGEYQGPPKVNREKFIADVLGTFLALRISYINTIAEKAERLGANIRDVMRGFGLDPTVGEDYLAPGIGWGGNKLITALDAIEKLAEEYLPEQLREFRRLRREIQEKFEFGQETIHAETVPVPFITTVKSINDEQIGLYLEKAKEAAGGDLHKKVVAVLGLAYKPGEYVTYKSRALNLIEALLAAGAIVRATDAEPQAIPNAKRDLQERHIAYNGNLAFVSGNPSAQENAREAVRGSDLQILVTDSAAFADIRNVFFDERDFLVARNSRVVDGRHFYNPDELAKKGIEYFAVGTPSHILSSRIRFAELQKEQERVTATVERTPENVSTSPLPIDDLAVGQRSETREPIVLKPATVKALEGGSGFIEQLALRSEEGDLELQLDQDHSVSRAGKYSYKIFLGYNHVGNVVLTVDENMILRNFESVAIQSLAALMPQGAEGAHEIGGFLTQRHAVFVQFAKALEGFLQTQEDKPWTTHNPDFKDARSEVRQLDEPRLAGIEQLESYVSKDSPLKDYTVVSRQLEAGLDRAILAALDQSLRRRFAHAIKDVRRYVGFVAATTLTGGLGALMHDLFGAWAKNFGGQKTKEEKNVIAINVIYETIKGQEFTKDLPPEVASVRDRKSFGDYLRKVLPQNKTLGLSLELVVGDDFRRKAVEEEHYYAQKNNPKYQTFARKARAIIGQEIKVDVYQTETYFGEMPNYYLDAYFLDENGEKAHIFDEVYPDSDMGRPNLWRDVHMAVYGMASELLTQKLREQGAIKKKILFVNNEVFVSTPTPLFPDAIHHHINHTVYRPGLYMPDEASFEMLRYPEVQRRYIVKNGKIDIVDAVGLSSHIITGVGLYEHTPVLAKDIVPTFVHKLQGYNEGGVRNTNGVLLEQWQAPLLRNLIEQYKQKLGLSASASDEEVFKHLRKEANAALLDSFQRKAEHIKAILVANLLLWLKEEQGHKDWIDDVIADYERERQVIGVDAKRLIEQYEAKVMEALADEGKWDALQKMPGMESLKEILLRKPIVSNIRRQVPYKGPDKWLEILKKLRRDPEALKRFKESAAWVIIGGREFGDNAHAMFLEIQGLVKELGLEKQMLPIENYNIQDAPVIFQGVAATVMLSNEFLEASATSMMKGMTNMAALIGVWGGAMPELFTIFSKIANRILDVFKDKVTHDELVAKQKAGAWQILNGFLVEYDHEENRRPFADSLVKALTDLQERYQDPARRRELQFAVLESSPKVDMERGQARAHIKLWEKTIRVVEEEDALFRNLHVSVDDARAFFTKTLATPGQPEFSWFDDQYHHLAGDPRIPGILGLIEGFREIRMNGKKGYSSLEHHAKNGDVFHYLREFFNGFDGSLTPVIAKIQELEARDAQAGDLSDKVRIKLEALEIVERLTVHVSVALFEHYVETKDRTLEPLLDRLPVRENLARYFDENAVAFDSIRKKMPVYAVSVNGKKHIVALDLGEFSYQSNKGKKAWSSFYGRKAFESVLGPAAMKDDSRIYRVEDVVTGEKYDKYPLWKMVETLSDGIPFPGLQVLDLGDTGEKSEEQETRIKNAVLDYLSALVNNQPVFEGKLITELLFQKIKKDLDSPARLKRVLKAVAGLPKEKAMERFGKKGIPAVMAFVTMLSPTLLENMQTWNPRIYRKLKAVTENLILKSLFEEGKIWFHRVDDGGAVVISRSPSNSPVPHVVMPIHFPNAPYRPEDGKAWFRLLDVRNLGVQNSASVEYQVYDYLWNRFYPTSPHAGSSLFSEKWHVGVPVFLRKGRSASFEQNDYRFQVLGIRLARIEDMVIEEESENSRSEVRQAGPRLSVTLRTHEDELLEKVSEVFQRPSGKGLVKPHNANSIGHWLDREIGPDATGQEIEKKLFENGGKEGDFVAFLDELISFRKETSSSLTTAQLEKAARGVVTILQGGPMAGGLATAISEFSAALTTAEAQNFLDLLLLIKIKTAQANFNSFYFNVLITFAEPHPEVFERLVGVIQQWLLEGKWSAENKSKEKLSMNAVIWLIKHLGRHSDRPFVKSLFEVLLKKGPDVYDWWGKEPQGNKKKDWYIQEIKEKIASPAANARAEVRINRPAAKSLELSAERSSEPLALSPKLEDRAEVRGTSSAEMWDIEKIEETLTRQEIDVQALAREWNVAKQGDWVLLVDEGEANRKMVAELLDVRGHEKVVQAQGIISGLKEIEARVLEQGRPLIVTNDFTLPATRTQRMRLVFAQIDPRRVQGQSSIVRNNSMSPITGPQWVLLMLEKFDAPKMVLLDASHATNFQVIEQRIRSKGSKTVHLLNRNEIFKKLPSLLNEIKAAHPTASRASLRSEVRSTSTKRMREISEMEETLTRQKIDVQALAQKWNAAKQGEWVLVVDDYKTNRIAVALILRRGGYPKVVEADNVVSGLNEIDSRIQKEGRPLIVTDDSMPLLKGSQWILLMLGKFEAPKMVLLSSFIGTDPHAIEEWLRIEGSGTVRFLDKIKALELPSLLTKIQAAQPGRNPSSARAESRTEVRQENGAQDRQIVMLTDKEIGNVAGRKDLARVFAEVLREIPKGTVLRVKTLNQELFAVLPSLGFISDRTETMISAEILTNVKDLLSDQQQPIKSVSFNGGRIFEVTWLNGNSVSFELVKGIEDKVDGLNIYSPKFRNFLKEGPSQGSRDVLSTYLRKELVTVQKGFLTQPVQFSLPEQTNVETFENAVPVDAGKVISEKFYREIETAERLRIAEEIRMAELARLARSEEGKRLRDLEAERLAEQARKAEERRETVTKMVVLSSKGFVILALVGMAPFMGSQIAAFWKAEKERAVFEENQRLEQPMKTAHADKQILAREAEIAKDALLPQAVHLLNKVNRSGIKSSTTNIPQDLQREVARLFSDFAVVKAQERPVTDDLEKLKDLAKMDLPGAILRIITELEMSLQTQQTGEKNVPQGETKNPEERKGPRSEMRQQFSSTVNGQRTTEKDFSLRVDRRALREGNPPQTIPLNSVNSGSWIVNGSFNEIPTTIHPSPFTIENLILVNVKMGGGKEQGLRGVTEKIMDGIIPLLAHALNAAELLMPAVVRVPAVQKIHAEAAKRVLGLAPKIGYAFVLGSDLALRKGMIEMAKTMLKDSRFAILVKNDPAMVAKAEALIKQEGLQDRVFVITNVKLARARISKPGISIKGMISSDELMLAEELKAELKDDLIVMNKSMRQRFLNAAGQLFQSLANKIAAQFSLLRSA
ncbi:MAG: hypothetical protein A2351_05480 [Omnitrophica bacterium RIFOXYB12_FULL_50_7]|nr:MAG: hypothetical protein A2351_05480 [Omnitrophica bacterium RIFOXYB12_FULL_50_7]